MPNVSIPSRKIRERQVIAFLRGVIVCALFLLVQHWAVAQSELLDVSFWPEHTLPTNGRILLWGSSPTATQTFERFAQGSLFLASADDTVRLTTRIPQFGKTGQTDSGTGMYELIPERTLAPETSWRLVLHEDGSEVIAYDHIWRTSEQIDSTTPEWNGQPAAIGGCDRPGESIYAYIAVPVDEPVLVVARISRVDADGTQQSSVLPFRSYPEIIEQFSGALLISEDVILQMDPTMQGNAISVEHHRIVPLGRGIYGGDLQFQPGTGYTVELFLVDSAGNHSAELRSGTIELPGTPRTQSAPRATAGDTPPGSSNEPPRTERSALPVIPVPVFRNNPE